METAAPLRREPPMKKRKNATPTPKVPTTGWSALKVDSHAMEDSVEGGLCGIEVLDVGKCENLSDYGALATPADASALPFLQKKNRKRRKKKKPQPNLSLPSAHPLSRNPAPEAEAGKKLGSPSPKGDSQEGVAIGEAWKELELHPRLLSAIGRCGFAFPLPIQSYCIPAAVQKRKDVLGAAQTGSGKTLAFGIPIFQRLLEERDHPSITPEPPKPQPTPQSTLTSKEESDDEELVEIESEDEVESQLSAGSEGVERIYEDDEALGISDHELQALHESLGTVYYAELAKKEDKASALKALVLTPTRELALQAYRHLSAIGVHFGIRVVPVVGGMAQQKQTRLLSYNPEVVVATPGRFLDLYRKGVPHLRDLTQLRFFVVDECDKMIRHGDFKDLTVLLQCLPEYQLVEETYDTKAHRGKKSATPPYRIPAEQRQMQTLLFSATLTLPRSLHRKLRITKKLSPEEDVDEMALALDQLRFRGEPVVVDLTSKAKLADKIQEAYLPCAEAQLDACLYSIIMKYPGRTLVFCNAIKTPIHAAKQQSQRLKALERFTRDPNSVMVATDVAARGLDIPDVRCVVHYNVPKAADLYIHRSGRTARVEADGLALSLVAPSETMRFHALFRALGRKLPPLFPVDRSSLQECSYRVKIAKRLRDIEANMKISKKDAAWTQKAAETLQHEHTHPQSSDDDMGEDPIHPERRQLKGLLTECLSAPLDAQLSSKYLTGSHIPTVKGMTAQQQHRATTAFKERLHKANQLKALRGGHRRQPTKRAANRIQQHRAKLAELVDKKISKKHKLKSLSYTKQKLVVIPPALGREAQGPDALQVMRDYMTQKQRSIA